MYITTTLPLNQEYKLKEVTVVDARTHDFLDQHGEPCWQSKNAYAMCIDAKRSCPYMVNMLFVHKLLDGAYEWGKTPESDLYAEQADFIVFLVLSGRFSDMAIQGNLGREMLALGLSAYNKNNPNTPILSVSFHNDITYRRVFGDPLLTAGMFAASDAEDLVFLFSNRCGIWVSFDSSTTDPYGSKRLLRMPASNRQAFFQTLYGMPTELYGAENSFVQHVEWCLCKQVVPQ